MDSGKVPRKLEIERRKRQFTAEAASLEELLHSAGVRDSSELVPGADYTTRVLCKKEDGSMEAIFPTFLPLEVFDDTEYDCRTAEEWLDLGKGEPYV